MDKILEKLNLDVIHSQHPNLLGSAAWKWAKKNIPLSSLGTRSTTNILIFVPFVPQKFAAHWIIKNAVKYANKADAVVSSNSFSGADNRKMGSKQNFRLLQEWLIKSLKNPDGEKIRKKYGVKKMRFFCSSSHASRKRRMLNLCLK